MDEVIDYFQPIVSTKANVTLCKPYTHNEVDRALAQMHPHKAPSPDDMNPFFFQKFLDNLGDDVSAAILSILHGHLIPPMLLSLIHI